MLFKKENILTAVILSAGIILALFFYGWLREYEQRVAQEKFDLLIQHYTLSIKDAIENNAHILNALAAYHYGSRSITRKEFHSFNRIILPFHPDIQAVEWIPEVSLKERSRYEKAALIERLSGFRMRERNEKGETVAAGVREYYYPVYFMEPIRGNEKALGFDLGSEPIRRSALEASKMSGELRITAPIRLLQERENKNGFLVYYPIYHDPMSKKKFEGFYLEVYRAEDFIKNLIHKVTPRCEGVNMRITDANASHNDLLYDVRCRCNASTTSTIQYTQTVDIGGRMWKIEASATRTFTDHYLTYYPEAIFAFIVILTGLIAGIHYLMARRYRLLAETNEDLRRFQAVAVGREERIRELKEKIKELENQPKDNDESS